MQVFSLKTTTFRLGERRNQFAHVFISKSTEIRQRCEQVRSWIKKFGITELDIDTNDGTAIPSLKDGRLGTAVEIPEISFGTNQLLPLISLGSVRLPDLYFWLKSRDTSSPEIPEKVTRTIPRDCKR